MLISLQRYNKLTELHIFLQYVPDLNQKRHAAKACLVRNKNYYLQFMKLHDGFFCTITYFHQVDAGA